MTVKSLKTAVKALLPLGYRIYPGLRNIASYRICYGRFPDLVSPVTFNEKLLKKLLFDRDPRLTLFADKWRVRTHVEDRLGGSDHLSTVYHVVTDPAAIRTLDLPNSFVMKPNHSCGQLRIVQDLRNEDRGGLEDLARTWLATDYSRAYNEWAYKKIERCILFEELLGTDDRVPDDYKFYCFDGQPRYIQFDRGRFADHRRNYYDLDLNRLPVKCILENFPEPLDRPENYDLMLEIVKALSRGVDFVRVDLYNTDDRIVFGEMTNYPGAGLAHFDPPHWDETFGRFWR